MRKIKELEARIDSITKSLTEMFLANSRAVRQFSCAIEDLRHDMDVVFTCNEEQGRKIKNLEADVVRLNKNITNVNNAAFDELSAKLNKLDSKIKNTSKSIELLGNEIEDIEERLAATEDTVTDIVLEDYCNDEDCKEEGDDVIQNQLFDAWIERYLKEIESTDKKEKTLFVTWLKPVVKKLISLCVLYGGERPYKLFDLLVSTGVLYDLTWVELETLIKLFEEYKQKEERPTTNDEWIIFGKSPDIVIRKL